MAVGPTFVARGTAVAGTAGITVGMPSGFQSNDILVLMLETAGQFVADPSGWTNFAFIGGAGTGGGTNGVATMMWWKRATGSETTVAVADSGDHQNAAVSAYRGCVATGSPIGQSGGAAATGVTTKSIVGASSLTANSLIVPFAAASLGSNSTLNFTSPGGDYASRGIFATTQGNGGTFGFADMHHSGTTLSAGWTTVTPDAGSQSIELGFFELLPLASITHATTGHMGQMGGTIAAKNKGAVAVTGAMGKMSGSASLALGSSSTSVAITGALGQMKGSANLLDKDGVSITGALGKMSGVASIINKMQAAIAGALGAMIGSATVTEKNTVAVSGSLGPVKGSASVGANEHVAIVGALGPMGGSVNLLDKDGVSVTGGLGAMSGSADIVLTEQLSVQGALGQMGADVLIHSAIGAAVTGTMGQMSGSAALLLGDIISVAGTMGQMSGEAAVMLREAVSIHGALGPMGAALTGTVTLPPGGTAITGALGQMKGAATLTIDDKLRHTVTGALGKMGGAIIARHMAVAVGGALHAMAGHVVATSGSPVTCYDVADDRRELILARLAGVLASVAGVASFKRNDPTVVESKLPAILMLDGDETAGVPRGWDKGRPAPFPMMIAMRPEVYLFTEEGSGAGTTLNTIQDAIIKAVLNDAELQSLCRDTWLVYEGSQVAFALGRALEGEMGLNFTFNYMLDPKAVCAPLDDLPGFAAATLREGILAAMARAVEGAEGVAFFLRNEITRPEEMSPAVFMLDGDEFVDPSLYAAGRPPTVPKPASADPEVYAVVNNAPEEVGQGLNRLRLMVLRTVLNDPLLTRLAADRDIRYEGVQTGLALGRSMAGEMGLKFSVRYVLKP